MTLVILGGYENRRTRAEIDSSSLIAEEAKTLRKMINDAQFFDLPETMTPATSDASITIITKSQPRHKENNAPCPLLQMIQSEQKVL